MIYPRIKDLRERNDLSQSDLAKALYISQRAYSHYESGDRKIPLDVIQSLADYYETSIDYIVGETDVMTRYPRSKQK